MPTWPTSNSPQLRFSRRSALISALTASFATTIGITGIHAEATGKTLQQPQGIDLLETRLKFQVEVAGEAFLKDASAKEPVSTSVKSQSTQDFLETIAFREDQPIAAARYYVSATGENWVNGKSTQLSLRKDAVNQRITLLDGLWEQYCPDQPLVHREVQLLRTPVNSLALEKLLPLEPARTDSRWTVSVGDAKEIFNLDAVHKSALNCKIASVEKGAAKVEIKGTLEATAKSVPTLIEVRGSYHVTMGSQGAIVSWLGISIKETREISEFQPGFNITARVQLVRQELKGKLPVGNKQLCEIADKQDSARWLVRVDSKCNFSMLVGREWVTLMDTGEEAILRLVHNNKAIALCNIAPLPKLDEGSQLTLEGLQQDIQKSLGKNFNQFVESSERLTGTKLRLMRVEAEGVKDDVEIRWIYAHLSDDSGRRLALVFTLAAEDVERFASADMQMLDSLEFTSPAKASEPTSDKSETASTLRTNR